MQRKIHQHPHQTGADYDGEDMHFAEHQQSRRQSGEHTRRQRQRQPKHPHAAEHPQQQCKGKQQTGRTHQPAFALGRRFRGGGKHRPARA